MGCVGFRSAEEQQLAATRPSRAKRSSGACPECRSDRTMAGAATATDDELREAPATA